MGKRGEAYLVTKAKWYVILLRIITTFDFSMLIMPFPSSLPTAFGPQFTGKLMSGMRHLCVLKADMSGLEDSIVRRTNRQGQRYWRLNYSVVMSFNRTELQAKLTWEENVSTVMEALVKRACSHP